MSAFIELEEEMIETGWYKNPAAPMVYGTSSGRMNSQHENVANTPQERRPLLSVLIPTVTKRKETFDELVWALNAQKSALPDPSMVEILTLCDNGEMMVGAKRNQLLDQASGEYSCFFDDDDVPLGLYLPKILKALETKPDVVGITIFWTDNVFQAVRLLVRSLEFQGHPWFSLTADKNITWGRPAHLNPTRSSIAKSERFPENVLRGEDADWSARVAVKCKTCVTIDDPIYYYNFKTAGTLTQRPGVREALRPPLKAGHQLCLRDGLIVELNECGEVVKTITKERAKPTEV